MREERALERKGVREREKEEANAPTLTPLPLSLCYGVARGGVSSSLPTVTSTQLQAAAHTTDILHGNIYFIRGLLMTSIDDTAGC